MRVFLKYIILFVISFIALLALNMPMKFLDYLIYEKVYLENAEDAQIKDNIILIHLPRVAENIEKSDKDNFRSRLTDLLKKIHDTVEGDKNYPKSVIIDFWFTNYHDQQVVLNSLKMSIKRLRLLDINVYATYDTENINNKTFDEVEEDIVVSLYYDTENYFQNGRLHTHITNRYGVLSYQSKLFFIDGMPPEGILALPIEVAKKEKDIDESNLPSGYILPIGDTTSLRKQTLKFEHPLGQIDNGELKPLDESNSIPINWGDKHIIIGDIYKDVVGFEDNKYKGPKLLAWALNDQFKSSETSFAKQPFNHYGGIIALVIFLSLFVFITFLSLFKVLKSLQTKPAIIATLSFLLGLLLLFGIGFAIRNIFNQIIPFFIFASSMLVVSLLAWHYSRQILIMGIVEGSKKYDVFISYRRSQSDWVVQNIYNPLKEFTRKDGSKLEIFFDTKSIKYGQAFAMKYTRGVCDSKLFLPIFSDDYQKSSHCMMEFTVAFTRLAGNKMKMFPVTFNHEAVPEEVTHLSYANADDNFITDLLQMFEEKDDDTEKNS